MTILIVIPVLTLLMFELGLTLVPADFRMVAKRPRTIVTGLIGQLLLLPVIAYILGTVFQLDVIFFLGLILIACSPGGSFPDTHL
jgi:BASS family bile acid:Na+ symporter